MAGQLNPCRGTKAPSKRTLLGCGVASSKVAAGCVNPARIGKGNNKASPTLELERQSGQGSPVIECRQAE